MVPYIEQRFNQPQELQSWLKQHHENPVWRISLHSPTGDVLADTHVDPSSLENQADRPELLEAKLNGSASLVRYSSVQQQKNIYVAIAIEQHGEIIGSLRLAKPMAALDQVVSRFQKKMLLGCLLLSLITGYLILRLSRTISRPLEHFRTSLQRYAYEESGIFHPNERLNFPKEIEQMAQVMDVMATRLDERTMSLAHQRHEEEVILSSMNEAVLAVDDQSRFIRINNSAAELFHLDMSTYRGNDFRSLIRNENLNVFLKKTLVNLEPQVAEICLFKPNPTYLEAHGSRLRSANGSLLGAVIVLNDVTRLKSLESVRREFVGNVTHELRTPITSIKGFVETLLDGDTHDAQDVNRFLNIISRQADRLNTIIDDLLSLSKIEQRDEETETLDLETKKLRKVLEAALWSLHERAEEKRIKQTLICDPNLEAKLHASLFEQAITNLIENAVKYSDCDKELIVRVSHIDDVIQIQVMDQGHGIASKHLPRLFERFYRVDKGRSRAMGGTGLGLSIVKHIIAAHKGKVFVESVLGKGSTFTIELPALGKTPIDSQATQGLVFPNT